MPFSPVYSEDFWKPVSTFASVAFSLHSVSLALTATVTVGASLTAQAEEELQSRQVLDSGRWNRKDTTLYLEGKKGPLR